MIKEIYGKKIGMTQIFNDEGNLIATTLIEVEPVYALEKIDYPNKTKLKIGCFKIEEKKQGKIKKPIKGYFDKLDITPYKLVREVEIEEGADLSFEKKQALPEQKKAEETPTPLEANSDTPPKTEEEAQEVKNDEASLEQEEVKQEGQSGDPREIGVSIFNEGNVIDVRAVNKGKGFAGGMKRHGWSGQPKSHGSTSHRRIGSAGASAYPSKIIKGLGMPGHMGNKFRTVKNLKVLKVDTKNNLLFISGNIPGARGALVQIKKVSK